MPKLQFYKDIEKSFISNYAEVSTIVLNLFGLIECPVHVLRMLISFLGLIFFFFFLVLGSVHLVFVLIFP